MILLIMKVRRVVLLILAAGRPVQKITTSLYWQQLCYRATGAIYRLLTKSSYWNWHRIL
jgi:hypothetical protein